MASFHFRGKSDHDVSTVGMKWRLLENSPGAETSDSPACPRRSSVMNYYHSSTDSGSSKKTPMKSSISDYNAAAAASRKLFNTRGSFIRPKTNSITSTSRQLAQISNLNKLAHSSIRSSTVRDSGGDFESIHNNSNVATTASVKFRIQSHHNPSVSLLKLIPSKAHKRLITLDSNWLTYAAPAISLRNNERKGMVTLMRKIVPRRLQTKQASKDVLATSTAFLLQSSLWSSRLHYVIFLEGF
uniref:Uncharacterized protein n=1 Tax=Romanomermis culicivorax TaxID=13658 RepID=A0A915I0L6_ROMCU